MKKFVLSKINWRSGLRFMYWTFHEQNGLCWLENDKGDYIRVDSEEQALELLKNQKQFGWNCELII